MKNVLVDEVRTVSPEDDIETWKVLQSVAVPIDPRPRELCPVLGDQPETQCVTEDKSLLVWREQVTDDLEQY